MTLQSRYALFSYCVLTMVTMASKSLAATSAEIATFHTDTYARSSADFSKDLADHYWHKDGETNVVGVIKEGTHGVVIKSQKTRDGQYASLVQISDGPLKGKQAWVFYDPKSTSPAMTIEKKIEKTGLEAFPVCSTCRASSQLESTAKLGASIAETARATQSSATNDYLGGVHPRWEGSKNKDAKLWSKFAYQTVDRYGTHLLKGARDMESFCPNYEKLDREKKIGFWVYLFSEMSFYESTWDPVAHVPGETRGKGDPITGGKVYAEGLMQISYGERVYNKGLCDELDWSKDRSLSAKDPRKTILNPYNNLKCAIRIFDSQLPRENKIASQHHDWAVLHPKYKLNSVGKIQDATKKIPFCKRS